MALNSGKTSRYNNSDSFIKTLLRQADEGTVDNAPLRDCLNISRSSILQDPRLQGEELWPYDEVYVPVDILLAHMNQCSYGHFGMRLNMEHQLGFYATAYTDLRNQQHYNNLDILRTIVRTPKLELDRSKLKQSSMVLAKLPNWSIFINAFGYGYRDFNKDLNLLSFSSGYKYNDSLSFSDNVDDCAPYRFLSIATFPNGDNCIPMCDLRLSEDLTIEESLKDYDKTFSEMLKKKIEYSGAKYDKKEYNFDDIIAHVEHFLMYLLYVIENQDKLKDKDGRKAAFKPNPEPTLAHPELNGLKIIQYPAKKPTLLFLD